MKAKHIALLVLDSVPYLGIIACGIALAFLAAGCAARGPMRVGQTYEVVWTCQQGGCAAELVTVAKISHGWVIDTHGYVFKPDRPLWFRPAFPAQHQPATFTPENAQ